MVHILGLHCNSGCNVLGVICGVSVTMRNADTMQLQYVTQLVKYCLL